VLFISLLVFFILFGMQEWLGGGDGYEQLTLEFRLPLLISVCMFFWSLSALLEGVLFREGLALKQVGFALKSLLMMILGVMATFVLLLNYNVNINWVLVILWVWLLGFFVLVLQQVNAIEINSGVVLIKVRYMLFFVFLFLLGVIINELDSVVA